MTLLAFSVLCLAVPGCQQRPPSLTGITVVALGPLGSFDLQHVARTRLGPPVPVIVVRPGSAPQSPGLPLNEPKSGQISVTLMRGTQSFTLYTTEWKAAREYVVGLFFDRKEQAIFALRTSGGQWEWSPQALGLDGRTLVAATNTPYETDGFRVTLDEVRFPMRELSLDLAGPWLLRPDQLPDLLGVVRLTVSVVPPPPEPRETRHTEGRRFP